MKTIRYFIILSLVFASFLILPIYSSKSGLPSKCSNDSCTDLYVTNHEDIAADDEDDDDIGNGTLRNVLDYACRNEGDEAVQLLIWEDIDLEAPIIIPRDCNGKIFLYGKPEVRNLINGSALSATDDFYDNCIIKVESDENLIQDLSFVNFKSNNPVDFPGMGVCLLGDENRFENNSVGVNPDEDQGYGNDIGVYVEGDENIVRLNHISQNILDGVSITGNGNVVQSNYIGHAFETCDFGPYNPPQRGEVESSEDNSDIEEAVYEEENLDADASQGVRREEYSERAPSAGGCQLIHDFNPPDLTFQIPHLIRAFPSWLETASWNHNLDLDVLRSGLESQEGECLTLSNGRYGVRLSEGANNNVIGGTEEGESNVIQYNGGAGVRGDGSSRSVRNLIARNIFYKNYGLGIDLGEEGVTPNDKYDRDNGPNNLLNYPQDISVIMHERPREGRMTYQFDISAKAGEDASYVEVYLADGSTVRQDLNLQGDPSGYGEGEFYITHMRVEDGWVTIRLPESVARGTKGTMLAFDDDGNTSEFSKTFVLDKDSDLDGIVDLIEDKNRNELVDDDESDPYNIDTDSDGLIDSVEDRNRDGIRSVGETAAYLMDTDRDRISDYIETKGDGRFDEEEFDTNPLRGDTDCDGVYDGGEDKNRDGVIVFSKGETDPRRVDSDEDGISDGRSNGNCILTEQRADNCPTIPNPDQRDDNDNNIGDVCELPGR